ncbi:MAG: HAD-IIA family hydrolase [Oscillospiraceae bacterium]|jgi:HAD superfamily hydrolase (TIGR01457 family)|nr:HAD-IIA family hydrolase [Oscillospiraceae bacterium]
MDDRVNLSSTRVFMLDMDGTFYLGDRLLDGSLDFLDALERTGREALFLTNNSSKTAAMYERKLERMGVPERHRRVYTSGQAAAAHCARVFANKRAFLLGTPELRAEMESAGIAVDNDNPDYVILAFDVTLDYGKMARLCDHVRAGLPYIATHPDFVCPTETGFIPDAGAIIAFVEAAANRRPDAIIGKPYSGIIDAALERIGADRRETALVGDRLYTDIAAGVNNGLLSIMVLTGEAVESDLDGSTVQPHRIAGRLSDLIPDLLAHPIIK